MSYEARLIFSEPLLRRAVLAFWRRSVGLGLPVVFVVVAISIVLLLARGDSSWIVGAGAAVLLFALAFAVTLYFVHYRNALSKLRDMGAPHATFLAEESSFTVTSGIGSSTLRWSSIREVWRFPDFWLLLFSKAQFMTVPLSSLSAEMQAFVLQHVQTSGGKIVG